MENANTIFQSTNLNNPNIQGNTGLNSQSANFPSALPNTPQPLQPNAPKGNLVQINQQETQEKKPKGGRFGGVKKLLNLLLSIFIVLGIVMIVMIFLIPSLNKTSPSTQTTITYWGLFEDNNVMQGIISEFEKQNPNIKVDYIKQDISQYRERLQTRINNGTGPDIFRFHNTWYPMLKNDLLPLPEQTISKDMFTSVFYPVAQRDLIKNGAIYGIPLQIDTLALFINTGIFQSAGRTAPISWEDFLNDARALTVKDSNGNITTAGAAMGTYGNVTHAPDIISLLFYENSVDFNNLSNSSSEINDALTFYESFANGANAVWNNNLDPSQLAFAKGNLAMFFGYSTDYFAIKQFNPNLAFQIVPVPQLSGKNITLASYWVEGVSAKSKHQAESLLFMKFLAKKETEQKLYADESKVRDFGEPYARVDIADRLKNNPMVYPFVMQAPNAYSSPFVDGTFDNGLNQQLDTYLQKTIDAGNNPVDALINAANQTYQQYGL